MLEKSLRGSPRYWAWILFLLAVIGVGFGCYLWQFKVGLGVTGLSRDVSWGFYIAQFTYLVGVAASAVMVVIPYYLHDFKAFGKLAIMGEFLAVSAVLMCMLFIFVDMGQPTRVMNMMLHPTPNSVMFWDFVVLSCYLLINITVSWTALDAERRGESHGPAWTKPLVYLSIPWAVSIHTVTAFLYSGLPGRHYWLTAIMAPRFLASAFASGPSFLIILMFIVRKVTKFDPGKEALQKLAQIVAYAMLANIFFVCMEIFTAFYSGIPGHKHAIEYLFAGLEGHNGEHYSALVPFMWTATIVAFSSVLLLVIPKTRHNENILLVAAIGIFISTWIDKGLGLTIGGFVHTPLNHVTEYAPTAIELGISAGVYAIGFLVLTVLYKIATTVREEQAA